MRLTKRSTAVHEAAHAVVAHYLGYRVRSIYLRGDKRGHVTRFRAPVGGARPRSWVPCPLEEALIALAGDAANYRERSLSRRLMSMEDTGTLERIGLSRYAVMRVLRPEAAALVRKLWPEVKRVATHLEARRWPVLLKSDECAALLRGRKR